MKIQAKVKAFAVRVLSKPNLTLLDTGVSVARSGNMRAVNSEVNRAL